MDTDIANMSNYRKNSTLLSSAIASYSGKKLSDMRMKCMAKAHPVNKDKSAEEFLNSPATKYICPNILQ